MSREIIPRKHLLFFHFQGNMIDVAYHNRVEFGISDNVFLNIFPLKERYETAFNQWKIKSTRNNTMVVELKDARQKYELKMRQFKNKWLIHNEKVDEENLAKAGLKRRKKKALVAAIFIDEPPIVELLPGNGNTMEVHFGLSFNEAGYLKRGKPQGSRAEIRYVIGGDEPKTAEDCPICESTGKSKYIIATKLGERGKKLFVFVRFATNNLTGCWSKIVWKYIP